MVWQLTVLIVANRSNKPNNLRNVFGGCMSNVLLVNLNIGHSNIRCLVSGGKGDNHKSDYPEFKDVRFWKSKTR